jgi:predicted unusual protein kinase regulating ubiquinone biosynthesis (AarF/ABC1/UbiB family)
MLATGRSGISLLAGSEGARAAEQALEALSQLRGLAAKVGQVVSYVDGLVPGAHAEGYARALARLQTGTAASPFEDVQRVVEAELGQSLETAFSEFDREPVASASIGQVHRARLPDGREVAVKVQHPGIEKAFANDLKNAGMVASVVSGLVAADLGADALFEEVRTTLMGELDYRREAEQQRAFKNLFTADERIHVPAVVQEYSTARVLVTEFVRGMTLEAVTREGSDVRRRYAELLWHFVFKSILHGGVFNADPHPGNYLFHADGRITFLDFGCTQTVAPAYVANLVHMHAAALQLDRGAFDRAARRGLQTSAGDYEATLFDYLWRAFEPLTRTPYALTREYAHGLVRGLGQLKRLVSKGAGVTPLPQGIVLLNRLQIGFYSVLSRLDVEADYRGVDDAILKTRSPEPR